jgi:hypothetical protein
MVKIESEKDKIWKLRASCSNDNLTPGPSPQERGD